MKRLAEPYLHIHPLYTSLSTSASRADITARPLVSRLSRTGACRSRRYDRSDVEGEHSIPLFDKQRNAALSIGTQTASSHFLWQKQVSAELRRFDPNINTRSPHLLATIALCHA
jgi:hypothetical protein